MKIKYEFANETVEVEVSEEWGSIVVDLDRQEYNANHRETRRHCSLEAYNLDDALIPPMRMSRRISFAKSNMQGCMLRWVNSTPGNATSLNKFI